LIFPVNLSRAVALNMLDQYLPQATVHQGLGFQTYIDQLGEMDISLSPFPYGNMNGLIDCARLGVPGVCMQGAHIHEAIDAGMWRRMGAPEWLIANDENAYEMAVCRLIDNPDQRRIISEQLVEQQTWRRFFDGDATAFANCVHALAFPSNHDVGLMP
jgi:predicted O-linked N-acetylglucosamine transferase (SPINDLY family)